MGGGGGGGGKKGKIFGSPFNFKSGLLLYRRTDVYVHEYLALVQALDMKTL